MHILHLRGAPFGNWDGGGRNGQFWREEKNFTHIPVRLILWVVQKVEKTFPNPNFHALPLKEKK